MNLLRKSYGLKNIASNQSSELHGLKKTDRHKWVKSAQRIKEIWQFIGTASWCRRFDAEFAAMIEPLNCLKLSGVNRRLADRIQHAQVLVDAITHIGLDFN